MHYSIGILWISHVVACGWYLCAALHDDTADTWVARRSTDADGNAKLVDSTPFDQWLCAMYFALTVCTSLGLGDIGAVTTGEIFYACFAMGVGVLVNSVVISEVINVVTSADDVEVFTQKESDLVEAFADHVELDLDLLRRLQRWVDSMAKHWAKKKYDRSEMKEILTDKFFPRAFLEQLPAACFSGRLLTNNFLWVCRNVCHMPPQLPILMAVALSKSTFSSPMEVVFQVHDYASSMFLVVCGTFAYVARPSWSGGIEEAEADLSRSESPWNERMRRRKLALAKLARRASITKKGKEEDEPPQLLPSKEEDEGFGTLFPYILFGRNSYFGDEGLARAAPRANTARCESENGELLSLSKVDLKDLGDQFPQFGARWAVVARQNERRRRQRLSELTFGATYRHFAASRIQTWFSETRNHRYRAKDTGRRTDVSEVIADAAQPRGVAWKRDMKRLKCMVSDLAQHFVKVEALILHMESETEI